MATPEAKEIESNIRIADFAQVVTRIGESLEMSDNIAEVLDRLRQTQITFATENDEVFLCIDAWLNMSETVQPGGYPRDNDGRRIGVTQLYDELRQVAASKAMLFRVRSNVALGTRLRNMLEDLQMHFDIERGKSNSANWWRFKRKTDADPRQLTLNPDAINSDATEN